MNVEHFFKTVLPDLIENYEHYPIIDIDSNVYRGNYSLILKAIRMAHDIGMKRGINTVEASIFNPYARNN